MEIDRELSAVQRRVAELAAGPQARSAAFARVVERFETQAGDGRVDGDSAFGRSTPRAAIDRLVDANAARTGIDPALIAAIISNESGFDPNATSAAGARGLMQLMPQTATGLGVANVYDPAENLRGGTDYLRGLLDRFGSVELAVAAYNAGPAAVMRYGGVPPYRETQAYVRNVMSDYRSKLGN
ncbi:MAG: lytic transglycosylase domain-containing protein [Candidatus Eremiobacteraeota bacterium]|nr:lytic transglycosylase domain-containing protein [Candidatus Eremiobacteraeota bacterium]